MSTIYTPRKIIYAPNDPFFDEGNIALRSIWLQKEANSQEEINAIKEEEQHIVKNQILATEIYCKQCRTTLPNVLAYELHYEAIHNNVCLECRKIFPGSTWLKLHLDECHNVILQLKKEQGEKIYHCYVNTCEKMLYSPKKRRLHLIDKHKYSPDFPFDLALTGTLTIKQRRLREKRKAKTRKYIVQKKDMDVDMDMDELTSSMAKMKLPPAITFGHRGTPITHKRRPDQKEAEDAEMKDKKPPKKRGTKKKTQNMEVENDVNEEKEVQDMDVKVKRPPRKRGPKKKKDKPQDMDE